MLKPAESEDMSTQVHQVENYAMVGLVLAVCRRWVASLACALLLAVPASAQLAPAPAISQPEHVQRATAPIVSLSGFVANHGQWEADVLFFARHTGIEATLMRDALVFTPQRDLDSEEPRPAPLVLRLPESSAVALEGDGQLPTQHHFLLGALENHVSNVPGYARVIYKDVVPGIDVLLRSEVTGFAYDLHVAPGSDLSALELRFEGAISSQVRNDGVLVLETESGPVEQRIGAAWQVDPSTGERVDIESTFRVLSSANGQPRIGFEAPARDVNRAFVLDPSLIFSTYIGGSGQDRLQDMDVGPDGSTYLSSRTFADAPTTRGAFDRRSDGVDAWVGKLSPDGAVLEWATFLGGDDNTEETVGVHLAQDDSVVVVGLSWSADFPSTPGTVQPVIGAPDNSDIFVTRLAADGASLIWSTFYGGPGDDGVDSSALTPSGDILLSGFAVNGMSLPATAGAYDTEWDASKSFLLRLSTDGRTVVFQTFFLSVLGSLVVDDDSNIYFGGGVVSSEELIATPGAFQEVPTPGSSVTGLLVKMDPMGSEVLWATYLGGSSVDNIVGVALDAASAVYVTGVGQSPDFPVTDGAFETTHGGSGYYVAKLLPNGSDLVWATFLSDPGTSQVMRDVVVDTAGNAIVTGSTNGSSFPTTPNAFQPDFIGLGASGDATLTKLGAFGEALEYSTYFGGSFSDNTTMVGLDRTQRIRMGLFSTSLDLFVTPGAYDTTAGGGGDISVVAFDLDLLPWVVLGSGLKGTADIPNLAGTGELTLGAPTRLSVRGGLPLAPGWFVVGLEAINLPFKGGIFVPAPTLLVPFTPNANGAHDRNFPWIDVPAGIDFYIQTWSMDPGGILGWSASNALQLVSQ